MADEERIRSYDRAGEPHDDVLRTKTGKVLTEQDINALAEEAEQGYDVSNLKPRDWPVWCWPVKHYVRARSAEHARNLIEQELFNGQCEYSAAEEPVEWP